MKTSELLKECFEHLSERFGAMHWWPAETPFEVMVGAILTQNTNWKNVEKAIVNLKNAGVMNPRGILALSELQLSELIKPAGFFRLKGTRLRNFVSYFLETYDGNVERMAAISMSTLREELLSVKGVGQETADSILLYALNKPIFVVDAYTRRIFLRHEIISEEADYAEIQDVVMSNLPEDVSLFNEFHALIVETAKNHCKTKPDCTSCPLNKWNGHY